MKRILVGLKAIEFQRYIFAGLIRVKPKGYLALDLFCFKVGYKAVRIPLKKVR